MLLLLGEGSNGKGALMRAIKVLLPDDAVCSIPPQLMHAGSNAGLHALLDALAKEGAIVRVNASGTIKYGLTALTWKFEEPEVEPEFDHPTDFVTLLAH